MTLAALAPGWRTATYGQFAKASSTLDIAGSVSADRQRVSAASPVLEQ